MKIYNAEIDDAYDIDVVIPIYDLVEYIDIYSKNRNFMTVL